MSFSHSSVPTIFDTEAETHLEVSFSYFIARIGDESIALVTKVYMHPPSSFPLWYSTLLHNGRSHALMLFRPSIICSFYHNLETTHHIYTCIAHESFRCHNHDPISFSKTAATSNRPITRKIFIKSVIADSSR